MGVPAVTTEGCRGSYLGLGGTGERSSRERKVFNGRKNQVLCALWLKKEIFSRLSDGAAQRAKPKPSVSQPAGACVRPVASASARCDRRRSVTLTPQRWHCVLSPLPRQWLQENLGLQKEQKDRLPSASPCITTEARCCFHFSL